MNLEEQLDENSWRTGRVVLVQPDGRQNGPVDGVGEKQVGKNLGHVPELSNFEPEKFCQNIRMHVLTTDNRTDVNPMT